MTTSSREAERAYRPAGAVIDTDPASLFGAISGVPVSYQYLIGLLRDPETGRCWQIVRSFFPTEARRFRMVSARAGEDYAVVDSAAQAYSGRVRSGQLADGWGFEREDGRPLVTTDTTSITWSEDEIVSVTGQSVGAATRYEVLDVDVPLIYTVRHFKVSGHIEGTPVHGVVLHEGINMPEGHAFTSSLYAGRLQRAWCQFVTELEDGTVQAGDLLWGAEGWSVMVVHSTDGDGVVSSDVEVVVDVDGDYPSRATYTGGGQTWVWEASPASPRWPILPDLPGGHRVSDGTVRRAGDTRAVVASHSFVEAFIDRVG